MKSPTVNFGSPIIAEYVEAECIVCIASGAGSPRAENGAGWGRTSWPARTRTGAHLKPEAATQGRFRASRGNTGLDQDKGRDRCSCFLRRRPGRWELMAWFSPRLAAGREGMTEADQSHLPELGLRSTVFGAPMGTNVISTVLARTDRDGRYFPRAEPVLKRKPETLRVITQVRLERCRDAPAADRFKIVRILNASRLCSTQQ